MLLLFTGLKMLTKVYLADKQLDGLRFSIKLLQMVKICVFWPKLAKKRQNSHFLTCSAPQILFKPKNSEFSANFDLETITTWHKTPLVNLKEPEMSCVIMKTRSIYHLCLGFMNCFWSKTYHIIQYKLAFV